MAKREKKKGIIYKEKSKQLSAINLYCTNIPAEYVEMNQIHDYYSLRWQIEILFKTWKSLLAIHVCKKVKIERLGAISMGNSSAFSSAHQLCFECGSYSCENAKRS
jgi:hypothetical protein